MTIKMPMNLLLIGMPGCGKSTVGVVLAKALGYDFLDVDLLIQSREHRLLQQIIDQDGLPAFLKAEDEALCAVDCDHTVVASGGSAVYSEKAMLYLKQNSLVIYLKLSLPNVESRLGNLKTRGIAGAKEWGIPALYAERVPLYERYGDLVVECDGLSVLEVVEALQTAIHTYFSS